MIAVDSSILIYAHRGAVPEHEAASQAIARAARDPRGWGVALASVAEFWRVVTHPEASGRPSAPDEARRFISALSSQGGAELWQPRPRSVSRLMQVAVDRQVSGGRIVDLEVALTAFENGATEIWSHDRSFATIDGLRVRDPLA